MGKDGARFGATIPNCYHFRVIHSAKHKQFRDSNANRSNHSRAKKPDISAAVERLGLLLMNETEPRRRLTVAMLELGADIGPVELCKRAGVAVSVYYDALRDPEFQAARREAIMGMFGGIQRLVRSIDKNMDLPGQGGASDRRLAAQMAGLVMPPGSHIQINNSVNMYQDRTDAAQLLWSYLAMNWPKERWLPAVRDQYEHGNLQPTMPPFPQLQTRQDVGADGPEDVVDGEVVDGAE